MKKYNKIVYGISFAICAITFLVTLASMMMLTTMDNPGFSNSDLVQRGIQDELLYVGVIASGLVCLVTFVYLIFATGERDKEGKVVLRYVDRVFTEITLIFIGLLIAFGGILFARVFYEVFLQLIMGRTTLGDSLFPSYFYGVELGNISLDVGIAITILGALITAGLGLWLILSIVRKIKARVFFKNSLIGRLVSLIYSRFLQLYNSGSTFRKLVLIALVICVLSAFSPLAPFVFIGILIFSTKWIRRYDEIRKGVEEARSGNFNYKIPVTEKEQGELAYLARSINEIAQASQEAVEKETRNQRLKTELISNVSHDLKTPLTSIIAYIGLLKKEGMGSPNANQYVEVLDQKTARLKQLTEDLFEAAKASSGDMPVRLEQIEMISIIRQALGEMSAKVEEAQLDFILNGPEEKYYAMADGQLMWRAMENLIGNAVKYAMPGSRVYLDLSHRTNKKNEKPMVVLEMKNISKEPLNISPSELMERFARGDESRNTEGSGLGLAITKDLMKLQKGWFDIRIDGDLFKAVLIIPMSVESEKPVTESAGQNPEGEGQPS